MSSSRTSHAPVFRTVYAVGALLVLLPLLEVALTVWPLRPAQATWRFGASGLLSNALLLPLLGTALLACAASLLEHRRALRALGTLSLVASVGLLLALGLFGLDTLRLRASVNPELALQFDVSSGRAALALLLVAFGWGWIGLAARATTRRRRREHARFEGAGAERITSVWGAERITGGQPVHDTGRTPA
jgi:hypothetical protein